MNSRSALPSFLRTLVGVLVLAWASGVLAQSVFTQSFTGTGAAGWVFGGSPTSTAPYLTANTVDTPGDGWLRMTENTANQATYALLDSSLFSVNAQIQIEMDYAFWNGTGADGLTFFLIDGGTTAATFQPGSYGGSMGYAQRTGQPGMPGAYLGFAFDNWGNFANPTEGRNGGPGFLPNSVTVRGPESSNYEFVATSGTMANQMDFPGYTTRPDQAGADYRSFRITLDANNQLNVEMKFGAAGAFGSVLTADLATYDRPDYFKIGFTGATGGANEIHEIRNLTVTMTPWQPTAVEWDNGAGTTDAAAAANWVGDVLPQANADLLFADAPASGPQVVTANFPTQVNSLTFDSPYNYTVNGTGTITLGNTGTAGLPSINVNDYNGAQAQHHINNAIAMAEELRINNYSFSTLCLNGGLTTNGNDIKVNGQGAVNFNSDIEGSGNLVKFGTGTTTIGSNNSDGGTPWTGNVTVNEGLLVVTANGALGTTGGTTTVNNGGTLGFRDTSGSGLSYSTTESVSISGRGIWRGNEGQTGALYNDGGDNSFAGDVTLMADAAVGSRDGTLTLGGVVDDAGGGRSLTKLGAGVVSLTGANTYTGDTVVEEGVLRVTTGSLPGGYNTSDTAGNFGAVNLAGGVLELASNPNFTRRLGTGEEQIFFSGDGGFSAFGGARTVSLTNSGGAANGQLAWNAGSFVPTGNALLLSSNYSDSTVTFTNAIDLGGEVREVRVASGTAAVDGVLAGVLSGTGGLNKTGAGTLSLTDANTYTGETRVSDGALRVTTGSLPGGYDTSNTGSDFGAVNLAGGVLELASNTVFTRSLGTGEEQLYWSGDGGFAAFGGTRTVRINNSTGAVTWGTTANFVGAADRLVLGSGSANNTLIFDTALDLGGGTRTIKVQDGSAAEDARLSQTVSNGSLTVVGDGRLDLTAANTLAGTLTVSGAELRARDTGTLANITAIAVNQGGTFAIDNTATNNANRINNAATVNLDGGTIALRGRSGNNNTSETVGALTLVGGANTVDVFRTNNNGSAQLTFASLTRNAGATVDFTLSNGGTFGGGGDNPRLIFTTAPALDDGILSYATVAGADFATHGGNGTAVTAYAGYNTANEGGTWTATSNVAPTSDQTLTAGRAVNAMKLGSGIDLDAAGNTLTLESGGLLSTGATVSTITNGTLRAGSGGNELITHVYGAGGLEISATIDDNGSAKGLTKSGDGTLTLSGTTANTFTGTTTVNDGTLVLNKAANVTAIAGNIVVGDGRGTDVLRIDADEQIANTANVTLSGSLFGGETILRYANNGGGITETFATLTIEGKAIIDFAGGNVCDANFLYLDDLLMAAGTQLLVRNWIDYSDFLLVRTTSLNVPGLLAQIQFEGYGAGAYWQDYDSVYSRITPVPEPSTYGAILMGVSLAAFGYRRWRRGRLD